MKLKVDEGALAVTAAGFNGGLLHRWSFNGDLVDSVGGQDATVGAGTPTYSARSVTMPGGKNGTSYLSLGNDILPKTGPMTVELWMSQNANGKWQYLFNAGSSQTDRLSFAYTDGKVGSVSLNHGNQSTGTQTLAAMTAGVLYHVAIVAVPTADGGSDVTAYLQNAVTGATIAKKSVRASFAVADIQQTCGWLGHSPYPADDDPAATYDEVRVWNRALAEAELTRSAKIGPDRLIPFELDDGTAVESAPAPVTAADQLAHRWSFNGNLVDSVGGQDATLVNGTAGAVALTDDNKQVRINPNGSKRANYVNLSANVLPKDREPITIEIWTTPYSAAVFSHIFCFSTGGQSGIMANYASAGTDTATGKSFSGNTTSINSMDKNKNFGTGALTLGEEFYYAVVIQPEGTSGAAVTAYLKNAATGATIGKATFHYGDWNVYGLNLQNCFLGASAYANWDDLDADASFNEVRIWKRSFSEAELANNVTLGPDALPDVSEPADEGNVLPENPDAELVANNYLTHRWPFNGTTKDVVGGQDATITGAPTWSDAAVTMPGGNNGTSYVNLGADILPTTGPVTVEIWLSQNVSANWGYLFNVGSAQTDRISLVGTSESAVSHESCVCVIHSDGAPNMSLAFLPEKIMCHYAVVLKPSASGGTDVTVYMQDASTGRTLAKTAFHKDHLPADILQANGWLGRSPYPSDKDPAATYDEVRIWNAALSEAQLTRNAQLGPDILPRINPVYNQPVGGDVEMAAGARLDLGGVAQNVQSLSGAGTVANGAANVIGTLSPGGDGAVGTLTLDADTVVKGTLKIDYGDKLVCNGDLDLRAAKLEVTAPDRRYAGYVFATSTKEGGIKGPVAVSNLPRNYQVMIAPNGRKAFIGGGGLMVIIR